MVGYRKDRFIYLMIPKNACTTYSTLLARHRWERFEIDVTADYSNHVVWAHIQNPRNRYTKGLEQYIGIRFLNQLNLSDPNHAKNYDELLTYLLSDPVIGKLLMSGVFDQHTYSISMMLGPLFNCPINWIPMDLEPVWDDVDECYLDCDGLTNNFFKEHGIDITVTASDHKNKSNDGQKRIHQEIEKLKIKYAQEHGALVANVLTPDNDLYQKVIDFYNQKYNK